MLFSYVQQTSYLTDDSIKNNILLGIYGKEINFDVLNKAITISELSRFINQLPSGLETNVCERGLALSGGQRQRIALARALYRNTPILILDEATSALDQETETKIIKNISLVEPKKTIIQISHRISSLSNCDLIYKITDGGFLRKYKN
jgi:ABC-type bacteriocin/lantibiotic exporter with double-glycine peptidase domain